MLMATGRRVRRRRRRRRKTKRRATRGIVPDSKTGA
jgi:hypothetical protein